MGVRIQLAETAAHLDALFRLRHRIFAEEKGYLSHRPDGRVVDRFDAFPTTANLVALVGDRVVGAARFVEAGPEGTPADEYFDFSAFLPSGARVASGGMLCLEPRLRGAPRVVSSMMAMGCQWALARQLTHLVAPAAPDVAPLLVAKGARALAPELVHGPSGLRVVPVMFDSATLKEGFLGFARRLGFVHFLHSFQRQFHRAGETVIAEGDEAAEAFVVVDGEAAVTLGSPPASVELARLGPGEAFGELALLTSRRRTATVVAVTDLDLMVVERDVFQSQLRGDPEVAARLLEILGTRLADLDARMLQAVDGDPLPEGTRPKRVGPRGGSE